MMMTMRALPPGRPGAHHGQAAGVAPDGDLAANRADAAQADDDDSNALRMREKYRKSGFQHNYKIGFKSVLDGSWRHAGCLKR